MENILSRENTPKHRPSSLARSQSSRQNRPPRAIDAQVAAGGGRGTILGGRDSDEEMEGVFGRARHTSLLSFDSIGGSFRAAPLMEQATAFESGRALHVICVCVCIHVHVWSRDSKLDNLQLKHTPFHLRLSIPLHRKLPLPNEANIHVVYTHVGWVWLWNIYD